MSQIGELKAFVSERLHAAASEILGAIEKTLTDYEEQAARLKEENDRHRSLLDIILKAKSAQAEAVHATKKPLPPPPVSPAAASPCASDSSPVRKARSCHYSDLQCAFTSRTDFLKFAANGSCPYCLKEIEATEAHLMRKHYRLAVHFTGDGTEKFVVPCMCKDRIQDRSHWHCPCCTKIIHRKCNFERHISKQHGYTVLQQSQDTEIDQPSASVFEEEVLLSPESWCQELELSQDQEDKQTSPLLQIKEEKPEMWRQVSHPESLNSELLQVQVTKEEQSLEASHAQDFSLNIIRVDTYSEINSAQSGRGHFLPNSSTEPLETQSDSEDTDDSAVYEKGSGNKIDERRTTHTRSSLKPPNSKRKQCVGRSLNVKKSTELPVSQNPHRCKACGKTFHYMYTLRTHAQTHAADKIHFCGICGKHLECAESLVLHLESHTKRNKCGRCGKQFSNISRLKQHRRFHRPKGLKFMSSAQKPQMGEIL